MHLAGDVCLFELSGPVSGTKVSLDSEGDEVFLYIGQSNSMMFTEFSY